MANTQSLPILLKELRLTAIAKQWEITAQKAVREQWEHGKELATWYLLSNVTDLPAETLAFWYYKRWEIESWFKVLKGHGFQLEHWQQETSEAIFRRLIVSSMACVLAWKLYQDKSEEAQSFKALLI